MKRRTKILIGILISMLLVFGIIGGGMMENQKIKNNQINFLKAHRVQMTDYIKSLDSRVENVEYDWISVQVGTQGNGLPQGGEKFLQLKVLKINGKNYFNNINDWISVYTDNPFDNKKIVNFDISQDDLQYFFKNGE